MSAQQIADEEIEVLLKTLHAAAEPLTRNQLRQALPSGRFKLPDARIADLLADLLRRELAFRFKPYGGKHERYWTRRVEEYARLTLLAALAGNPLTRSDLMKKTAARLQDYSEDKRRGLLNELVKEEAVRKWPALIGGRSELFCTRPPESQYYFQHVLSALRRKLGLSEERLIEDAGSLLANMQAKLQAQEETQAPPAPRNPARAILDAMARLVPPSSAGAAVSVPALRQAVKEQIPEKVEFDRTVLGLAEQETLALHYHDFPASLSPGELDELVTDGRGHFYVGVALRI